MEKVGPSSTGSHSGSSVELLGSGFATGSSRISGMSDGGGGAVTFPLYFFKKKID